MKKILIILGILVFINILVITVSKAFAQEAGVNSTMLNNFQIISM